MLHYVLDEFAFCSGFVWLFVCWKLSDNKFVVQVATVRRRQENDVFSATPCVELDGVANYMIFTDANTHCYNLYVGEYC